MKKLILSLLMLGYGLHLSAQKLNADLLGTSQPTIQSKLTVNNRAMDEGDETSLDPMLKPFYHGVASGDPLSDRVIIWTRITPEEEEDSISVSWKIATDTAMENIISSGEFQTSSSRDYTVKVDVTGLSADTYYYYEFESGGRKSLVGRAKTASEGTEDHLKFAVVSCSNYEAGYFNAYGRIADRNDLDAVLHLGDYIYEYETSVYGDSSLSNAGIRAHQGFETVSVDQYRARYSLYRLDKDLRRAHQQHSFICVWDDHESANDAYKDGAENHQPDEEGDWEERKEMARKAYYEWIPIREQESDVIYRSFSYGDLLDLIMLDTRLEGREIQRDSVTDPLLYAPDRTMLGTTQRDWFFGEMGGSSASWKLIGNQVVFSEFNVGWAADPTQGQTPNDVEALFLDIWDGYPQERQIIIDYIRDQEVDNVIMVTGDIHSSFAFEVADTVNDPSALYAPVDNYDPETGEGAVAVEFVTPSISSANFDENVGAAASFGLEFQINNPLPAPFNNNPNPHMKYNDLDRHGYFVLDVKADSAQSNFYYIDKLNEPSEVESFGVALYAKSGGSQLIRTGTESAPKAVQADAAPATPDNITTSLDPDQQNGVALFGLYPNPVDSQGFLHFGLKERKQINISLINLEGRTLSVLANESLAPGVYNLKWDASSLPVGIYQIVMDIEGYRMTRSVLIKH